MCGIEVVVGPRQTLRSTRHRGPDQTCHFANNDILITFHRLAIQDTSRRGDQPFRRGDRFCVSNGELYNARELIARYHLSVDSGSDMEVWLPLLDHMDMATACRTVDGMFATVVITDTSVFLARDRVGVKPLFYQRRGPRGESLCVASEAAALEDDGDGVTLEVPPGALLTLDRATHDLTCVMWATYPVYEVSGLPALALYTTLRHAVRRRLHADRPIGCFLSGGLDSSVIAALLTLELPPRTLHTFSIGFDVNAPDLRYARLMAAHLDSIHHEVVVTEEDGWRAVPRVIQHLGSYDTTTVRASTPMFLLSEYVATTDVRVVFSGEGSDELLGGYLYFHYAPSPAAFGDETRRLTSNLYLYDVLRADRCTAAHGLEFREPFLDTAVVDLCLNLPPAVRHTPVEKQVLRDAFAHLLPAAIVERQKAAFSDAVSTPTAWWFQTLQKKCRDAGYSEAEFYERQYFQCYRQYQPIRPLWLPRWVDAEDPSATLLSVAR